VPPEPLNSVARSVQRHLPTDSWITFLALCPVALIVSVLPFYVPNTPRLAFYTRHTRLNPNGMMFLHLCILGCIISIGIFGITALKESLDFTENIAKSKNLEFDRNGLPVKCMEGAVGTVGAAMILLMILIATKGFRLDNPEVDMSHLHPAHRPQPSWQLGLRIRNALNEVRNISVMARRRFQTLESVVGTWTPRGGTSQATTVVGSEEPVPPELNDSRLEAAAAGRSGAWVRAPSDLHPNPAFRRLGITSLPSNNPFNDEYELTELPPPQHGGSGVAVIHERAQAEQDQNPMWTNTFPRPVVGVLPRPVGNRYTSAPPVMETDVGPAFPEQVYHRRPESPF
jgi:hypothetical protein